MSAMHCALRHTLVGQWQPMRGEISFSYKPIGREHWDQLNNRDIHTYIHTYDFNACLTAGVGTYFFALPLRTAGLVSHAHTIKNVS